MAKRIYGYGRGKQSFFDGTLQRLNGKVVRQGELKRWALTNTAHNYTQISTQLPNGGSKTVSRSIPKFGLQDKGDLTKITTVQNAKVGGKNVQTVNKEFYEYGADDLRIAKSQMDSFNGGKRIMSKRPDRYPTKEFYDANNKLLKTVIYDNKTGLRIQATSPDGRVIHYDAKGLPTFTNAYSNNVMDLDGLDRLI